MVYKFVVNQHAIMRSPPTCTEHDGAGLRPSLSAVMLWVYLVASYRRNINCNRVNKGKCDCHPILSRRIRRKVLRFRSKRQRALLKWARHGRFLQHCYNILKALQTGRWTGLVSSCPSSVRAAAMKSEAMKNQDTVTHRAMWRRSGRHEGQSDELAVC